MSSKTTIFLLLAVIIVGAAIWLGETKAPPPAPTVAPQGPITPTVTEQSLLDEDFGDVQAIRVKLPDEPEWHFVREPEAADGPTTGWRMTAPAECGVADWQVAQIGNRLKNLKYAVKYEGDSGMSPAEAGLEPPRAIITLTGDDDKKVTVEVGRHEGDRETYVRLRDGEVIYRVRPSLKNLLKDKALAYREQQLVSVPPESIVKLDITERPDEGELETYAIVKVGGEWRFTHPAPAKAMADKIRTLRNSFRSLRATEWVADEVEDFARFGLAAPALTVTATIEETPPVDDTDTNGAGTNGIEEPPAPVTKTYTVHFANVSPLGEDSKVYVRRDDDRAVATIMKSVADTFKPDLKAWRENRLIERDPATARRVELTVEGESRTFTRAGTQWSYAESGATADSTEMRQFLNAIKNTEAVNFVGGAQDSPAEFGLADPRAVIVLAFDADQTHRIVIGGYADPAKKRLVYVQVDGADSVAKVHVSDANALLRPGSAFRDKSVLTIRKNDIERIVLGRPANEGRQTFAFEREDGVWSMTAPVGSAVNDAQMSKLVNLLAELRAQRIVEGDVEDLGKFGLDDPQFSVEVTYAGQPIVKIDDGQTERRPGEPVVAEVLVSRGDDAVYAHRPADPGVVYVVGEVVVDILSAEYRKSDLYSFDAEQVSKVTVRHGDLTQGFTKSDGQWEYVPESDIPVEDDAVTNYVLRVADLKVDHVVAYHVDDMAAYGLDEPAWEVGVELDGHALPALLIADQKTDEGLWYARSADAPHVLALPADTAERIRIDLAEFERQP